MRYNIFVLFIALAMTTACAPGHQTVRHIAPEMAVAKVPTDGSPGLGDGAAVVSPNATRPDQSTVIPDEEETALVEEVEPSVVPPSVDASTPLTPQEETALKTEPNIHFDLDLRDTKDVQLYFRYYTRKHRKTFARWLKRAEPYLPYLRDEFKKQGLPQDLIFLPFAESGFNPWAYSWAGAAGMWQFMPATGRRFGLQVGWWLDERRNPFMATEAAIGYLKRLYKDFNDWYLALAAYNAGEGTIGRALRRTGCDNFFDLAKTRRYLKRETRHYVPKFIAILKIVQNLEELGFEPINWDATTGTELVRVKGGTDLLALASHAGLSWKGFRRMNPAFRRQVSPPGKTCDVYLPPSKITLAKQYLDSPKARPYAGYKHYRVRRGDSWWRISRRYGVPIAVLKKVNGYHKNLLRPGQRLMIPGKGSSTQALSNTRVLAKKRANYRVKKGDTIWDIARRFGTSSKTLLRANGMRSGRGLQIGQKLYIPDGSGTAAKLARKKAAKEFRRLVRYHVRKGDNLWRIARRFGVTTKDLFAWNNLNRRSILRPGDRIKIYVDQ
ncbi:LysM peptidoglycan-binding domain-containing protein [Desulfoplanes sp.]